MSTNKWFGITGSIILFIGVFMPIIRVPIVGDVNYFRNGEGDGIIILVLAGISLILVLMDKFKALWLTGLGSLSVLLFTFMNFRYVMSQTRNEMESQLAGNPFRELAEVAMQSVQLQWGWAILVIGAVLIIGSAAMKRDSQATSASELRDL